MPGWWGGLGGVLKNRDIILPTKVCLVKDLVFPVVVYGCESWTIKKAVSQRIDACELWSWRRLLSIPWIARQSNQSTLKEINLNVHWKDWCWSWNSNTLATWWEEQIHWKRPWCWERLKAGGEGMTEDEMVGWHHWLSWHESEQALEDGEGQGNLACCCPWRLKVLDTTKWLNNIRTRPDFPPQSVSPTRKLP